MSRKKLPSEVLYVLDSLEGVIQAAKRAKAELLEVGEDPDLHPEAPERLVFPVLDRAQTTMRAAKQWESVLVRRGGR